MVFKSNKQRRFVMSKLSGKHYWKDLSDKERKFVRESKDYGYDTHDIVFKTTNPKYAKFERCVKHVKKQKGYNPYAVCRVSTGYKGATRRQHTAYR